MIKELLAVAIGATEIAGAITRHVLGTDDDTTDASSESADSSSSRTVECDGYGSERSSGERQTTLSEYGF